MSPGLRRFGLFAAVSLLTRAPFLGVRLLDLDEAAHWVATQVLLRGGTLYVDVVDNRPPLLYCYYALAQALFGPGLLAVRVLTALVTLPLTAFAASAFYRHDRRGLAAGLLYLVYGAAFLAHDMHSVSCEVLMLLPLAWSLVLVREEADARRPWRLLAAGALVGVGVLLRQQAALALPALVVALWPPAGGLAALAIGFALPLAATWAVFAARAAASALLFWTVVHNLRYAANPIPAGEAAQRCASYLLPFLVVTGPLWWASFRSLRLFDSPHQRRLVAALLACSLPAPFLGLRFFPHYFIQLYLPLALAAAPWSAAVLARRPLPPAGRVALGWALGMLAAFTFVNGLLYSGGVRVYEETRPVFRDTATRLRADPCFGRGPLFVWGFAPALYLESGLTPASRFIVPQASLSGYVPGNRASRSDAMETRGLVRPEHWDLLMADLRLRPPAFVLDTAPSNLHGWGAYPMSEFPRLRAFVDEGYQAVAIVDGIWIWRRRGCADEPADPSDPGGRAPAR